MFAVLTNDDGIHAPGLRALYRALLRAGHTVQVIAPLGEKSATGHALTVHRPLRVKPVEEDGFSGLAVEGTPVDCVKLGLSRLVDKKPDLLISGMNSGGNVGPDIIYSGTLAAASEGAFMGCSSLAVSHNARRAAPDELDAYACYAVDILRRIPWSALPPHRAVSLNLPGCPLHECKGLTVCPQSGAFWRDWYEERHDPHGRPYWWMDGVVPPEQVEQTSDKFKLEQGWATLTPLKFEFTDHEAMTMLQDIFSP